VRHLRRGADQDLQFLSLMVSGTPRATPEAVPKLWVMSLRTMPLWVRMLAPLEPSPG
jgi:hypothetical protein